MEMKMKMKTHFNLNNIKKDHTEVIVSNIFLFFCKKKVVKRHIKSLYAVHGAWYGIHKVFMLFINNDSVHKRKIQKITKFNNKTFNN